MAISSSVHPTADIHAEPVIYGRGGDGVRMLFTVPNERGSRATRPLHFALAALRRPADVLVALRPAGWSRGS